MPDYTLRIVVTGEDRATPALRGVGGALANMSQIAGGIIGAGLIMKIGQGFKNIARGAIMSAAGMQAMETGLVGLIAREIAQGEVVKKAVQATYQMTDAEKLRLISLQEQYPKLESKLRNVETEYQRVAKEQGENSKSALLLHQELTTLQGSLAGTSKELSTLKDKADGSVSTLTSFVQGGMSMSEALPLATGEAKKLMDSLAEIAILSPYQVEMVQNTFRQAMAFGYSSKEAVSYTKALLDAAAGVGANNEMLGRMSYNFAQIRMQGRVTALDIRQLAMAGFDLTSVLQYMGEKFGIAIKDHNDFNAALASGKITWQDFTEGFAEYSEKNFGGAAERMSKTLMGLQSTFKDVFTLTFPQILGPGVEIFAEWASKVLDSFLKIRNSPLLPKAGEAVAGFVKKVTGGLGRGLEIFDRFITYFSSGLSIPTSIGKTILDMFGVEKYTAFLKVMLKIREIMDTVSGVFTKIWEAARPFVEKVIKFIAENVGIEDVLTAVAIVIGGILLNAVISLGVAVVTTFGPIILAFLALVAAVAFFRKAWTENLWGIRDKLTAWWEGTLKPALMNLWQWLQINIPIALQTLKNFWYSTLLPAIQVTGAWITGTLIPALANIWAWLSTNIPAAIATLVGWWDAFNKGVAIVVGFIMGTVVPIFLEFWNRINAIWDLVANYIIPIFTTIGEIIGIVMVKAIEALMIIWNEVFAPKLKEFSDWLGVFLGPLGEFVTLIGTKLKEGLDAVWAFMDKYFMPILLDLKDKVLGDASEKLATFWDWLSKIKDTLSGVFGFLTNVKTALATLDVGKLLSLLGIGSGNATDGQRAEGGPVWKGKTYLVGEKGPELFSPSINGRIVSNKDLANYSDEYPGMGGGGGKDTVNVFINATVDDSMKVEDMALAVARRLKRSRSQWAMF